MCVAIKADFFLTMCCVFLYFLDFLGNLALFGAIITSRTDEWRNSKQTVLISLYVLKYRNGTLIFFLTVENEYRIVIDHA
jgi:hypothetical protein